VSGHKYYPLFIVSSPLPLKCLNVAHKIWYIFIFLL